MKLTTTLDPRFDGLEERVGRRIRHRELLPIPRRACQVRQAFLFGFGPLRVVGRVAIRDQGPREVLAQQLARYFAGTRGIEPKVDVLFGRVQPVIGPLAVEQPIRFIGIHCAVAGGDFFADVLRRRLGRGRQQLLKPDQGGGREVKAKQVCDGPRHFAETDADVVAQVQAHGPQPRSDHALENLAFPRLLRPQATRSAAATGWRNSVTCRRPSIRSS